MRRGRAGGGEVGGERRTRRDKDFLQHFFANLICTSTMQTCTQLRLIPQITWSSNTHAYTFKTIAT